MDWSSALANPAALRANGLFLAEGRLVLEGLLGRTAHGADAIVAVLCTPAAARALGLEARLPDRLTIRTPAEMKALTGFDFHRGVLALVRRPSPSDIRLVIASAMAGSGATTAGWGSRPDRSLETGKADEVPRPLLVVAEHLVDVDNVGSCFRNARAFGVTCVLLDDRCADPLYRKAVRTSIGTVLEVPWGQAPIGEILDALAAADVQALALTPREGAGRRAALGLRDVVEGLDPRRPLAVVIGNEGGGLSEDTMSRCTHLARIPMAGGADSLNVATALAVALYECVR